MLIEKILLVSILSILSKENGNLNLKKKKKLARSSKFQCCFFFFFTTVHKIQGPRATEGRGILNGDVIRSYKKWVRVVYYEEWVNTKFSLYIAKMSNFHKIWISIAISMWIESYHWLTGIALFKFNELEIFYCTWYI